MNSYREELERHLGAAIARTELDLLMAEVMAERRDPGELAYLRAKMQALRVYWEGCGLGSLPDHEPLRQGVCGPMQGVIDALHGPKRGRRRPAAGGGRRPAAADTAETDEPATPAERARRLLRDGPLKRRALKQGGLSDGQIDTLVASQHLIPSGKGPATVYGWKQGNLPRVDP